MSLLALLHELAIKPVICAELSQSFTTVEARDAWRYRTCFPTVEVSAP